MFARTSSYSLLIFIMLFSCRKAYDTPYFQGGDRILAVDGFIYTGTGVTSTITLSRSTNLGYPATIPELNAQVTIQSSAGDSYKLTDSIDAGIYGSPVLNLDSTLQYRLAITTSDGNKYMSDYVSSKQAPPIDSLTWGLVDDPATLQKALNIYVHGHDPTNGTRYYRWDFQETYKHFSTYKTIWGDSNGLVYSLPVPYGTHTCWSTFPSHNIIVGTTATLSQDVLSQIKIASFQQNDPILDVGCSFLVRQYPLTEPEYNYWLNVQTNSQSLGGLFDPQPSQVSGNLHCITKPANPVIGYISASTVQSQRIYISNKSLPGWQSEHYDSTSTACYLGYQTVDPLNTLLYTYQDTSYAPYFFYGDALYVAPKSCLDCRYQGGTNIKPSFWPLND